MIGDSGSALLTLTNSGSVRIRFFNGTGFGSAHNVPLPKNADDSAYGLQQVGGITRLFLVDRRLNYDLATETTRNGVHWSRLQVFGEFIDDPILTPVLGPSGSGILLGGNGDPALAQPILNPQSVTISLAHRKISGHASPALTGQEVTLQRLSGHRWYNVASTHEKSGGKFSFTLPGVTRTYRAVVADKLGYYEFGYSTQVTLKVQ